MPASKQRAVWWTGMLAAALIAAAAGEAAAQVYPTRPVTIVVPFAAGGGNDIMARLLGQHMSRALGQQFVIENRGGAGGPHRAGAGGQGAAHAQNDKGGE